MLSYNETRRRAATLLTGIFFMLLPFTIIMTKYEEKEYYDNGIKVTVHLKSIRKPYKQHKIYNVVYEDKDGNEIEATATIKHLFIEVGDTFEGYYLESKPKEVYCPTGKKLKIFMHILITILFFLGLYSVVKLVRIISGNPR